MVKFNAMAAPSTTHYDILKLRPDATAEQIRAAYKEASRLAHPDMRPNDPQANAEMAKINASYEILSDPERRAEYDLTLPLEVAIGRPVTVVEPAAREDGSHFIIPDEADEKPRVKQPGPYRARPLMQNDLQEADDGRAFLIQLAKKLLPILLFSGGIVFLLARAGGGEDGGKGWLIIRAFRKMFSGW